MAVAVGLSVETLRRRPRCPLPVPALLSSPPPAKESFSNHPYLLGFNVSQTLSERVRKRVYAWFGRKLCVLRGFGAF